MNNVVTFVLFSENSTQIADTPLGSCYTIESLVRLNPPARRGRSHLEFSKFEDISNCPYSCRTSTFEENFKTFGLLSYFLFSQLEAKQIDPPYRPNLADPVRDLVNFDTMFTDEDAVLTADEGCVLY